MWHPQALPTKLFISTYMDLASLGIPRIDLGPGSRDAQFKNHWYNPWIRELVLYTKAWIMPYAKYSV